MILLAEITDMIDVVQKIFMVNLKRELFPINFAAIKIQLQHHIDKMQHSAFQHNHFISYFYILNVHRNFLADTI